MTYAATQVHTLVQPKECFDEKKKEKKGKKKKKRGQVRRDNNNKHMHNIEPNKHALHSKAHAVQYKKTLPREIQKKCTFPGQKKTSPFCVCFSVGLNGPPTFFDLIFYRSTHTARPLTSTGATSSANKPNQTDIEKEKTPRTSHADYPFTQHQTNFPFATSNKPTTCQARGDGGRGGHPSSAVFLTFFNIHDKRRKKKKKPAREGERDGDNTGTDGRKGKPGRPKYHRKAALVREPFSFAATTATAAQPERAHLAFAQNKSQEASLLIIAHALRTGSSTDTPECILLWTMGWHGRKERRELL